MLAIDTFFKGFAHFFLRVAQTFKERFFVYADDTDSMNDDMKWIWNSSK